MAELQRAASGTLRQSVTKSRIVRSMRATTAARGGPGTAQATLRPPAPWPHRPATPAEVPMNVSRNSWATPWRPSAGSRRWARRAAAATAAATSAAEPAYVEQPWSDEELGPAAWATLGMLDWSRLCSQVRLRMPHSDACSAPPAPSFIPCVAALGRHAATCRARRVLDKQSTPTACCSTQVATFAQTTLGQRAAAGMLPPPSAALSQRALEETRAVDALEAEFAADLDFGGIHTAQCGQALARAARGGLLSGAGLQAVASLLAGAAKLQRAVKVAAREAEATGYQGLLPVTAAFKVPLERACHDRALCCGMPAPLPGQRSNRRAAAAILMQPHSAGGLPQWLSTAAYCHWRNSQQDIATLPELVGDIGSAIEESGVVRESASDDVRRARVRVRTIEGRIRGILKVRVHQASVAALQVHVLVELLVCLAKHAPNSLGPTLCCTIHLAGLQRRGDGAVWPHVCGGARLARWPAQGHPARLWPRWQHLVRC